MSMLTRKSFLIACSLSLVACSSAPPSSERVRLEDESRGCCCNGNGVAYAYAEADGTLTCDDGWNFEEPAVCNEIGGPCFDHFPVPDAGLDAGDSGAGEELDGSADGGELVACTAPNTYTCSGGGGVECCSDGFEREFADGPCYAGSFDAGVADCEADEYGIGCPCATEDESHCRLYRPSLICRSGFWSVWTGHVCC